MDLIKCRKCSQRVWARQRVCPKCGTRLPLWQVLWSFAHGEGKGEVVGAAIIIIGMCVGLYRYQQVGGLVASFGVIVFFVGRFARRVRQHLDPPGR